MDPIDRGNDLILIVDDHDDTRELFAELLAFDGFSVLSAATGGDALALAREHRPCLILLDLGLPDIAGLELVLRLRAEPNTATVPIYALSGFTNLRSAALAAGIDGFLIKPVTGSELREIVAQHCATQPPPLLAAPIPLTPSA